MARSTEDLVKIGVRFKTGLLLEQADVSQRQASEAAAALGRRFGASRIEAIGTLRQQIATGAAERDVQAGDVVRLTQAQEDAFADGKDWIRDLLDAAATAFDGDEKKLDQYTDGSKIGSSVPRLLARLETHSKLARDDAAALDDEGFDAADVARGPAIATALRDADKAQEAAIRALPAKTRDVIAAKGQLYLQLKGLVRAARRTWRGDRTRASAFELKILKRGGASRESAPPPGAGKAAVS
jgi:hypothetical protein